MPVIGPEVLALVEKRAVILTTLGFEASFTGENVIVSPEAGEV